MRALHRLLVAVVAALVAVVAGCRRDARDWVRRLRAAPEAVTVGLRAIPSMAWFPLAILLFQLTESAILVRDAARMRSTRGCRLVRREALALAALPTLRTSPHLLRTVRTSSRETVHRTRSPLATQPHPEDQRKSLRLSR